MVNSTEPVQKMSGQDRKSTPTYTNSSPPQWCCLQIGPFVIVTCSSSFDSHLAFFLLINQKRYLTILDLQNLAREFAMTRIKFWPRGRSSLHLLGSQPHLHHIGLFGWGDIRRIWPLLDRVPAWLKKNHQQVSRSLLTTHYTEICMLIN